MQITDLEILATLVGEGAWDKPPVSGHRWNPDYRSASLGYCFDDAAWGHGYATEATRGSAG